MAFSSLSIQSGAPEGKVRLPVDYTIPETLYIDLDHERIDRKAAWIDSIFNRLHKRSGFNGAVLYGEKGRMVYKNAFGIGDYRKKDTLTSSSSFQLASVSKMITATAIMILKEKGRLDFDDTLTRYFPDFPYREVTIRHLMTHRSGLSRYMSLAHEKWTDKSKPFLNGDMLELFIKHKPDPYFQPDKGFHYCNTNYALLACVVEEVAAMPFERFVKMEIFRPLEMNNSFVYNHRHDTLVPFYVEKGVPGYNYSGWRLRKVRDYYLNGVMGDKGVYSTVEDLFKLDQAFYDHLLLSEETLHEAFSPGSPDYWKRKDNYGFGWRIRQSEDSCVYHYGWWKGFRAFFIRDMKQEKTIIVLSNRSKGPGSRHFWDILKNKDWDLGYMDRIPIQ